MFFHTLHAEWSKLRSTASFWWTTGLIIFFGLIFTVSQVLLIDDAAQLLAEQTIVGVLAFAPVIIMIQAIMTVTTEYRYGVHNANFLATPSRWQVAAAKLVLYAVIAGLLTFLLILVGYLIPPVILDHTQLDFFDPFAAGSTTRAWLWQIPLLMMLLVAFVQGLGWLVRHTAGTVSLALIWYGVLENVVTLIPRVGAKIVPFLPFTNYNAIINNAPVAEYNWDLSVSWVVFIVWAVALWIIGVVTMHRRDA